jgi:hypothetical protein
MIVEVLFTRTTTPLTDNELDALNSISTQWLVLNERETETYGPRRLIHALVDDSAIPTAYAYMQAAGVEPRILGVWTPDGLPLLDQGAPKYPCQPDEYAECLPDAFDPVTGTFVRPTGPVPHNVFAGWAEARQWR